MRALTVTAMLLAFCSQGAAETRVTFAADVSCGTWTADHEPSSSNYINKSWGEAFVIGYVSGANQLTERDFLDGLDGQAVLGWFNMYCASHPTVSLTNAANVFISARTRQLEHRR